MKCKRCGNKIPKGRLEALPETQLCVKCSEEVGGDFVVTFQEENHYKTPQSKIVVSKTPRHIEPLEG